MGVLLVAMDRMIIISLFVVTCVFGAFGLPSHSATKEAEKQDETWRKQIKAIKDVEDFLGGNSSSLDSSMKEFKQGHKDWIKQLMSWEKANERVQKNEEFL